MPDTLRILCVYIRKPLGESTAAQRVAAIADLGHVCTHVNWERPLNRMERIARGLRRRLLHDRSDRVVHREILDHLRRERFDLLWIDKGSTILPDTLWTARQLQPHMRIAGYSPDDMLNPVNRTKNFLASLPHYDVYFTTKSFHVVEFHELGAPRVVFVGNAFHPALHRPVELTADERARLGGPLGFIGEAEDDRAGRCARLAAAGVPLRVWGGGWSRWKRRLCADFDVAGGFAWGEEYVRIINALDINLCFLRKVNRDRQTTRSVEIPACGAFMLAERTDEHLALFDEGVEAEFFESDEELLEKSRYYTKNADARKRIAAAGRARCVNSGYSNHDRLREMLRVVFADS